MPVAAHRLDHLDDTVETLLASIDGPLRIAAPLGIGKPHRLLNALYARIEKDPSRELHLYTALSLDPPSPAGDLQRRFLTPFLTRHFGDDFPRIIIEPAPPRSLLARLKTLRPIEEDFGPIDDLPADPVQGVSASLGVASTCTQPLDLNALMNSADKALYQAKASGRNQVAVVD